MFVRSGGAWTHQQQLVASDGATLDRLGLDRTSVAVSGDTVVIGASANTVGSNVAQGSAYVFVRSAGVWSEQAQIAAAGGATDDLFGTSASIDGDTIGIGAPHRNAGATTRQGSAYVFTRSAGIWMQQAVLAGPVLANSTKFGSTVAVQGTAIAVGARGASRSPTAPHRGAAYIFDRVGAGPAWTLRESVFPTLQIGADFGEIVAFDGQRLIASGFTTPLFTGSAWIFDAAPGAPSGTPSVIVANPADAGADDRFGLDVAVSGNYMVIGSRDDDIGANANQGSAYVFERASPSSPWVQVAKLTANDGGAGDELGERVAIDGNTIVLSATINNAARGAAYVFVRNAAGVWVQTQKLLADSPTPGDRFGNDIDIQGSTMVIGAFLDDGQRGSAFVFTRDGFGSWNRQAKLQNAGSALFDFAGTSVALDGDKIAIGVPGVFVGSSDNRGVVSVFVRSGFDWILTYQFTPDDTTTDAYFGEYVDIENDTLLVGAWGQRIDGVRTGAAYVYSLAGNTLVQQARLAAPDRIADDRFGNRVVLRGDTAVIGSPLHDQGGSTDSGAAYVYSRIGSSWTFRQKLSAFDFDSNDIFGQGLEIDGSTVLVGAGQRLVNANAQQGAVYAIPLRNQCVSHVHNLTLNVNYPSIAAALAAASSGHQIGATSSDWSAIGSIDTLGRSIGFSSAGWIATPPSSIITLGGSSYLAAGTGRPVEILGQLRLSSNASADVSGSSFLLGSRGSLTARTGSSLSISTPTSTLLGTTRLEPNAALTFGGSAASAGELTGAFNASIVAAGPFSSSGNFTLTAGTIAAPSVTNTGQTSIFGSSAIFGSFANAAGATTTIRSGSLFVFGSLTNNGVIVGTICSNCLGTPPNMDVAGDLVIGQDANLSMPFDGSVVRVGGSFDCAINDSTRFDLSLATLQLEGPAQAHDLEVMSRDVGTIPGALDMGPGKFPIGAIRVGPSPTVIRVVDLRDNDGQGQGLNEALYVRSLRIDAGSRLDNSAAKVYYSTLVNNGVVDVPANLIQLPQPCDADFDQSGVLDIVDIFIFLNAWFAGSSTADFDQSGELEIGDIFSFLNGWFAGCP